MQSCSRCRVWLLRVKARAATRRASLRRATRPGVRRKRRSGPLALGTTRFATGARSERRSRTTRQPAERACRPAVEPRPLIGPVFGLRSTRQERSSVASLRDRASSTLDPLHSDLRAAPIRGRGRCAQGALAMRLFIRRNQPAWLCEYLSGQNGRDKLKGAVDRFECIRLAGLCASMCYGIAPFVYYVAELARHDAVHAVRRCPLAFLLDEDTKRRRSFGRGYRPFTK